MASKFVKLETVLSGTQDTCRGKPTHISVDKSTKTKLVVCCSKVVSIIDLKNPKHTITFNGHKSKTTMAKISPNGYYCCSGDENGNVLVWSITDPYTPSKYGSSSTTSSDEEEGDQVITLNTKALTGDITDISWSPDSQRIVVVGEGKEKFGYCFFAKTGASVGEIAGHGKIILSCDFKPSRPFRICTTGEDNIMCFHKGPPFKFDHSDEYKSYVNCGRFSPDGSKFAVCSSDKTIKLYDGKTGKPIVDKDGEQLIIKKSHKGSIYSLSWFDDNKHLVTCGADKAIKIINTETQKVRSTYQFKNDIQNMQVGVCVGWENKVISLSLNGDINIFSNPIKSKEGEEGKIVGFDKKNGPELNYFGHRLPINDYLFDEKSNSLFTCGDGGRLIQFDMKNVNSVQKLEYENSFKLIIKRICLLNNKKTIVFSLFSGETYEVDIDKFAVTKKTECLKLKTEPIKICSTELDDETYLWLGEDKLFIIKNKEIKKEIDIQALKIKGCSLATWGNIVAIGSDRAIYLFEMEIDSKKDIFNLKQKNVLKGSRGLVKALKFSKDGKILYSGDNKRELMVWDYSVDGGKEMYSNLVYHNSVINAIDVTPDDKYVISTSMNKESIVWDLKNNVRITNHVAHQLGCIGSVCISNDECVTIGAGNYIKKWKFGF